MQPNQTQQFAIVKIHNTLDISHIRIKSLQYMQSA
jgi:hypothetical protein